jgi:hypothetical protein
MARQWGPHPGAPPPSRHPSILILTLSLLKPGVHAARRRRRPPGGSLQRRASWSMAAPLAKARAVATPGGRPSASSRGGGATHMARSGGSR